MTKAYKIIPEGKNKGMRLYDELTCDVKHALPIEMTAFFDNALKNNCKIFVLNCISNHKLEIPKNDLYFLNKIFNKHENLDAYDNYVFSKEVIKIKELQYLDIKQLYDIAIKKKEIHSFFINPYLESNFYCFNVCLIVNSNFNLTELLNLDFNLIKINSVNEYINSDNIVLTYFKNLCDLYNSPFKDYKVSQKELKKTRPYDELKLPERLNYNNYVEKYLKFINENPGSDVSHMEKEIDFLDNE